MIFPARTGPIPSISISRSSGHSLMMSRRLPDFRVSTFGVEVCELGSREDAVADPPALLWPADCRVWRLAGRLSDSSRSPISSACRLADRPNCWRSSLPDLGAYRKPSAAPMLSPVKNPFMVTFPPIVRFRYLVLRAQGIREGCWEFGSSALNASHNPGAVQQLRLDGVGRHYFSHLP